MFNWTTNTIINSLKDYSTGLPLIKVWDGAVAKDAAVYDDLANSVKGPAGMAGAQPVIKIKRDRTFEQRWIRKVYKAVGHGYKVCAMDIKVDELINAIKDIYADENDKFNVTARLSFYVALEGSEESIYANDWYQKGKPFSIGFSVSDADSVEKVAKRIKRNAEKYGVVTYGKKVFDIALSDDFATMTLTGTHEYQRFAMAAVAVDEMIDERVIAFYGDNDPENEDQTVFELKERGVNGFGTYHQLIKDRRLPTAHNNNWLQRKEDEKPVVGGIYNQYIITYCAPSMANPGFTVVGQHNMSVTTHSFWVLQDIADEFEAYLTAAGITPEVAIDVQVDTDTKEFTINNDEDLESASVVETTSVNHEQEIEDTKE